MEYVTDADYEHAKRVCKDFKIKNLEEYQDSKRASKNPFDHSSDRDFINLYKKCTEKPCSFLVIATPLASDNPLRFRKNLLERT